jgi:D-alanyl-D-alanine carboxypeptidase/D-alanyl-D-alanine-endopeptidase (penicillin-binding protein 4)
MFAPLIRRVDRTPERAGAGWQRSDMGARSHHVEAHTPALRPRRGITLLWVVALLCAMPGQRGAAASPTGDRQRAIAGLLRDRALRNTRTSIYVADACSGQTLYARHADIPVNPASNVKLLSTAAALEVLGAGYVFRTRLLGRAADAGGVVDGDVYLLGSYDPMLQPAQLFTLARAAADAGVTRVAGRVLVGTRQARDGIYRSRVTLRIDARDRRAGAPAVSVSPPVDFVEVAVHARVARRGSRSAIRVRSEPIVGSDRARVRLVVSGRIARGKVREYRHDIADHTLFAGYLMRHALIAAGIEVGGRVAVAPLAAFLEQASGDVPVVLAEHESAPLRTLVTTINKFSVNWLADRLIQAAGAAHVGGRATIENAVGAMKDWLRAAGVVAKNLYVDTGSGLSYRTAMSVRQIVEVLRAAAGFAAPRDQARADAHSAFWESLPIAGVDGTLVHRFKRSLLRGRVRAKTGTLSTVVALSGFFPRMETGEPIAFAIVSNDVRQRRRKRVMSVHERIIEELYLESRTGLRRDDGAAPCATPSDRAP